MTSRRVPEDPTYWEALATRIERAAWAERAESATLAWLAARLPVLAGALAAAAALLLWSSASTPPRVNGADDWFGLVAPSDRVGREIAAAKAPALAALIVPAPTTNVERRKP